MKEWLLKMGASDWIAAYAAIISTVVLLLEAWKYSMGGPRLTLRIEPPDRHQSIINFVHISVTNSGSSPVTIIEARLVVRNDGKKYKQNGLIGYSKDLPLTLSSTEQLVVNLLAEHITMPGHWLEIYCTHRATPYVLRLPDPIGKKI